MQLPDENSGKLNGASELFNLIDYSDSFCKLCYQMTDDNNIKNKKEICINLIRLHKLLTHYFCGFLVQNVSIGTIKREFEKPIETEEESKQKCKIYIDKNGKQICEGDIIRINNSKETFYIKFNGFECEALSKKWKQYRHRIEDDPQNYEVVGNVYNNPELLTED